MENLEKNKKTEKFSYSKLSVYEQCPFKYKLTYVENHYINQPSIATDFGTLIHFIEETMANTIKKGNQINYNDMIELLYTGALDKDGKYVKGVNHLKEEYPVDFITPDKNGRTYIDKIETYIDSGMCRLEDYLAENPDLEVYEAEKPFTLTYRGYTFTGKIDRIFRNKRTNEFLVEDIKTYGALIEKENLTTPLQFVIYKKALELEFPNIEINCAYELPLCNAKQEAGTKGFVERGFKKIDKLLDAIESKDFSPKPCPLCHWCVFSGTFPNQPEEAKNLCPYYSHWTRENKDFSVENDWMGEDNHAAILEAFINSYKKDGVNLKPEIKIEKEDTNRRFLLRR